MTSPAAGTHPGRPPRGPAAPPGPRVTLRRLARDRRVVAVFVVLWTTVALVAVVRVRISFPQATLWQAFFGGVLDEGTWAGLSLLAYALTWRVDLFAGGVPRKLALLVVAAVGMIVGRMLFNDLMIGLFIGWRYVQHLGWELVAVGPANLLVVLTFYGTGYALDYYFRARDRELAASRLEAQLAQAHLQVLKTQLQPHFLFNTFHSISALMYRDPRAANRMLTRLSDLLRLTLHRSATQEVTLQEELDGLALYLEIEQTRFSDRLRVEWAVDDAVRDACVPHLVLQPLVENSIRHGISKRKGPGVVTVSAKADGDALRLEVRDNGPGLPPEGAWRNGGIGLANTRGRLEQLYGDGQTFEIANAPEGGAMAAITLPLRFAEGAAEGDAPLLHGVSGGAA